MATDNFPYRQRDEQNYMVRDSSLAQVAGLVNGWRKFANVYAEYHGADAAVAKAIHKCADELADTLDRVFPKPK